MRQKYLTIKTRDQKKDFFIINAIDGDKNQHAL